MLLYGRLALPLILGSLSFVWVVLSSDFDFESYIVACGATGGALICVLVSANWGENTAWAGAWRRRFLVGASVVVGAGCALTMGWPAPPSVLALGVAAFTHVVAGVGAVLFLRGSSPDSALGPPSRNVARTSEESPASTTRDTQR